MNCGLKQLWCTEENNVDNPDIIYEEHNIPIYFEEEVIAVENEGSSSVSYNNESIVDKSLSVPPIKSYKDHFKSNQTQKSGSHTPNINSNFKPFVLNEHTMKIFKNKIKAIQKRRAQALAKEKKQRPKKLKNTPYSSQQSHQNLLPTQSANLNKSENFPSQMLKKQPLLTPTIKKPNSNFQYKPKPSVDPSKSGQILRMEKVDSDDIEIDILSNSEDDDYEKVFPQIVVDIDEEDEQSGKEHNVVNYKMERTHFNHEEGVGEAEENEDNMSGTTSFSSTDDQIDVNFSGIINYLNEETSGKLSELKNYDEATYNLMNCSEHPTNELILDLNEFLPVEKIMLSEFFSGSETKNPKRYLKIRNHIIDMWKNSKPLYLSKTVARQGLRKCGDVNTIGRVHLMLENLGVINFGCAEVKWILPLKNLYNVFQMSIRNKNQSNSQFKSKHNLSSTIDDNYQCSTTSSDSMVNRIKSRTHSRTQFELIKCHRYSKENVAPFDISITLSCLLCLYFHALSSKLEIMGFLGGHIDKSNEKSKISLKCYKPCRTSISTTVEAEMCPVSQVEQSSDLSTSGYELLGWFHSHPTFPATPSRTDLKTQNEIQLQFAPNNPFIGFILSCLHMDFK